MCFLDKTFQGSKCHKSLVATCMLSYSVHLCTEPLDLLHTHAFKNRVCRCIPSVSTSIVTYVISCRHIKYSCQIQSAHAGGWIGLWVHVYTGESICGGSLGAGPGAWSKQQALGSGFSHCWTDTTHRLHDWYSGQAAQIMTMTQYGHTNSTTATVVLG